MNNDIETARTILKGNNYTCVLYYNKREYHSTLRGVKPLIEFLESNINFNGFSAADKVVGCGAAHLYVLLGIKALWAGVISKKALKILQDAKIDIYYDILVPHIINRSGDGLCPIESAVENIDNSTKALDVIKQTLERLSKI